MYRRRRLLVLLILLAIIGVAIWLVIAQPWASAAQKTSAPAVTPSASSAPTGAAATPSPSATVERVPSVGEEMTSEPSTDSAAPADPTAPTCTRNDVSVEAVTDQTEYASGQNPQLSIRLTNTGSDDCTINVGTTTQKFTITSGSDTWWRSTDCQSEPSDMIVTLTAGQSVTSAAPLSWDRTRSSVGSCDSQNRPVAPGRGASYHLGVEIGGIPSTKTVQFFLY